MSRDKETAQRGNAGGEKVNHQRGQSTTAAARCASSARRFGPNLGECIILALAIEAGAGRPR